MRISACIYIILCSLFLECIFIVNHDFSFGCLIVIGLCLAYIFIICDKERRRRYFYINGYNLIKQNDLGICKGLGFIVVGIVFISMTPLKEGVGAFSFFFGFTVFVLGLISFIIGIISKTKYIQKFREEAERIKALEYQEEKEKAQKRKLKELRSQNIIYLKANKQNIMPIITRIRALNSSAKEAQEKVLEEQYTNVVKDYLTESCTEEEYDKAVGGISKWEISPKREFVRILFKLVVCDDGIKNDEWYTLQTLMVQIKLNPSSIKYLNRIYEPLRTERDYYEQKKQEAHTQTTYQSGLSPYYAVLGLTENATSDEIQAAYHKLALLYHPDLPKNANRRAECETMMAKINEAYEKIGTR